MSISKKHPDKAVGYIRVSTEKQAANDDALVNQAERIRECCRKRGIDLIGICEDVASAADPLSVVRRPGLSDARKRAREENAMLIVTEPTRLFRNLDVGRQWLQTLDVPIFSVRDARRLGRRALLRAFEEGEEFARRLREGTSEAMKKVSSFVDDELHDMRSEAAKRSVRARRDRSDAKVDEIVFILRSRPAGERLTHTELADILNQKGILTGWGRSWSADSVRRFRKRAEERIREMDELDAEEDLKPKNVKKEDPVLSVHVDVASEIDEEAAMRNNPLFGMF